MSNTPTSGQTNRLTGLGVADDDAGNLTSWTGNGYEHDRLDMLTRRTAGAEDWVFVYTADDESGRKTTVSSCSRMERRWSSLTSVGSS